VPVVPFEGYGFMTTKVSAPPGHSLLGYSLVELVIVIACACLLLALAVPNFERLRRQWSLWGAARLLEASLQWGRMHAISGNTSLKLAVDEDGRRFYWQDPQSGEPYANSIRYLPGRIRIVGCPRTPLRFHAKGNAAPAGTYILQGEAGLYRVVVNPAGRIRVE